jgi:uncharacterized iron-regulated membrane protein
MSVRTVFLKLHLWMGLGAALLVVLLAATGTMLVYDGEIDRMLNPKLLTVAPQPQNLPVTEVIDCVRKQFKLPPAFQPARFAVPRRTVKQVP